MPEFDIDINFNVETGQLEEAKISLNELVTGAEEVSEAAEDIDSSNIEDLGTSADTASSSTDDLSDSLENVDSSSLDEASSNAEELSESLNDATNSADDLSSSMGVLEGGMLLSVGQQIQGISSSSESMAQDMDNAAISIGQLATNAGMAEPQMTDLIANISNATFPKDEAMAYVDALNQMGVSADQLGDSATNMDKINDATQMGYTNVLGLTQGLRSMGIEANQLPSAFNAIAYAEANVNGGAQTLSTVLKRQASTINEYGLSVDQTVLIMNKLSESGVSVSKMGSALSNVLKENNGDIQAIEQSLDMEAGALANASDVTGQYEGNLQALANQEAEHKTITQQFGAAWDDVTLKMSGVLSPMASIMGFIGQVGSFGMTIKGLKELATTMGGARAAIDTIRNSESIWIGVKTVLAGVMGTETAVEEANAIAKEANAAATATETVANEASLGAKIAATASNWALAISESAVLLPLLLVVGAVLAVAGVLWYLYNNNETVRASIDGLIGTLWGFIGVIANVAQQVWDYLVGLWNNLVQWFMDLQAMTPLQILQLVTSVIANLNPLSGLVNNVLGNVLSVFITQATSWITNTVSKASKLVTDVHNKLRDLPNKVTSAVSGVSNALTKPFTQAWDTISGIYNDIKEGIEWIGNNMPSFGFTGTESFGYTPSFEFDGTLNESFSNGDMNKTVINNNNTFDFNGIIDKEAGEYIVEQVNDYIVRESLLRGDV